MRKWLCLLVVACVALAGGVPAALAAVGAQHGHAGISVDAAAMHDGAHDGAMAHHGAPCIDDCADHAPQGANGSPCLPGLMPGCGMFPGVTVLPAMEPVVLHSVASPYGRSPERLSAARSTVPDPRPPRASS